MACILKRVDKSITPWLSARAKFMLKILLTTNKYLISKILLDTYCINHHGEEFILINIFHCHSIHVNLYKELQELTGSTKSQ